tara:strand:+ start:212 stop:463 length:252 start_codon:yes stop_codon:yes gene_type:complete
MNYKKGQLVYMPAGARVVKFADEPDKTMREEYASVVSIFRVLEEPHNVLLTKTFLKNFKSHVCVYYDGEEWFADKRNVYPINE